MTTALLLLALAADPTPGDYDGLVLGVDPATHVVTGYFSSSTGEGKFSCIFFFTGKAGADEVSIESYFPATPKERIAGTLAVTANEVRLSLKEEHGGCWNVQHFADADSPVQFSLSVAQPTWQRIAIVKSPKARFVDAPNGKAMKAYLVEGDAVGVLETKGDWLHVAFVGGKGTSGWMKKATFY